MAAMQTELNLEADAPGTYAGKDTEINGAGYAGMTFTAHADSQADFDAWVASVKSASSALTMDAYNALSAPSEYNPPAYYASYDPNIYNSVMMKYMAPQGSASSTMSSSSPDMSAMPGMHM
jgi:cytochrome o ubiquinol oxidase subunit II